jgi:L-threonylcarbamoyladenylate synthase
MSETRVLPAASAGAIAEAQQVLVSGGVVAFPTDTVYGIGVAVQDAAGIERLYAIKGRDAVKAIPVLAASVEDLVEVAEINAAAQQLAQAFWPGALTLVLPKRPGLPQALSPLDTVGVRVPNHPVALALLAAVGPMAVTSANFSGGADSSTAAEVLDQLQGRVELLLDGGRTPGASPSTVVALSGESAKILRAGPISEEQITALLSGNSLS